MNENVIVVMSLMSVALFLVFLFWLYRDYRVDCFRQEMFALRDSFFDEAANGLLDFESDGYGMIRSTMNGFIRFGHKISLPHLMVSFFVLRNSGLVRGVPFSERLDRNIESLSHEQKQTILKYYQEMNYIFIRHVVRGSPLFTLAILPPLILSFEANRAVQKLTRTFRRPIDSLDTLAHAEGQT